jgi:hypothetical protein
MKSLTELMQIKIGAAARHNLQLHPPPNACGVHCRARSAAKLH